MFSDLNLKSSFKTIDPLLIEFINSCCCFEEEKRLTAE